MLRRLPKRSTLAFTILLFAPLLFVPAANSSMLESNYAAFATKGLAVAPVALNYDPRNWEQVGYGSYLVNSFGCSSCHTPVTTPPTLQFDYQRYFGGVCSDSGMCTKNLTPDQYGMPGGYDIQSFVSAFHGSGGPWEKTFYHSPFLGGNLDVCASWYNSLPLGGNGFPYGFTSYDCFGDYCGFRSDDGKFFGAMTCDACKIFTPGGPGYPFTLGDSELAAIYAYLQAIPSAVQSILPPFNGPSACLSVPLLTYPGYNWVWANNITGNILQWDGTQWVLVGNTSTSSCLSFPTGIQIMQGPSAQASAPPAVGITLPTPPSGQITINPKTGSILQWNGTQWQQIGTTSTNAFQPPAPPAGMVMQSPASETSAPPSVGITLPLPPNGWIIINPKTGNVLRWDGIQWVLIGNTNTGGAVPIF